MGWNESEGINKQNNKNEALQCWKTRIIENEKDQLVRYIQCNTTNNKYTRVVCEITLFKI